MMLAIVYDAGPASTLGQLLVFAERRLTGADQQFLKGGAIGQIKNVVDNQLLLVISANIRGVDTWNLLYIFRALS